jgi:hypothetical protein
MIIHVVRDEQTQAEVVKLVDTQRSGRCARKGMGVRVPPSASSLPKKSSHETLPITLPRRQGYRSTLSSEF